MGGGGGVQGWGNLGDPGSAPGSVFGVGNTRLHGYKYSIILVSQHLFIRPTNDHLNVYLSFKRGVLRPQVYIFDYTPAVLCYCWKDPVQAMAVSPRN